MFVRGIFGELIFIPRGLCFVEGEGDGDTVAGGGDTVEGGDTVDGGVADLDGEAVKVIADGEGDKIKESDWRAQLTSEEAREFAKASPDAEHLVKRALETRKLLSKAIIPPGKDATEEEIGAYRKKLGVPASPEGYKFEMPEGEEAGDADKAFHKTMGEAFHKLNISAEQAKGLNQVVNAMTVETKKAQIEADKQYADESEAALKAQWGGDYDANVAHADRAIAKVFGDDIEEIRHMETKDGRFVADHPTFLKAMAAIGREMQEGGLVPKLDAAALSTAKDAVEEIRAKIAKANDAGNHKEANRLYQEEQKLLTKIAGNGPIVGAGGRAA